MIDILTSNDILHKIPYIINFLMDEKVEVNQMGIEDTFQE